MEVKAMPKKAKEVILTETERRDLQKLSNSHKEEARLAQRAKAVLGCARGRTVSEVGRSLGMEPETVIKWRNRYLKEGLPGLQDKKREGRPKQYGVEFEQKVLETLNQPAPNGQAGWDGPTLAKQLNTSVDAVWRYLKKKRDTTGKKKELVHQYRPFLCDKSGGYCRVVYKPAG
jgi:transposase